MNRITIGNGGGGGERCGRHWNFTFICTDVGTVHHQTQIVVFIFKFLICTIWIFFLQIVSFIWNHRQYHRTLAKASKQHNSHRQRQWQRIIHSGPCGVSHVTPQTSMWHLVLNTAVHIIIFRKQPQMAVMGNNIRLTAMCSSHHCHRYRVEVVLWRERRLVACHHPA